jgi:hypothetical protein
VSTKDALKEISTLSGMNFDFECPEGAGPEQPHLLLVFGDEHGSFEYVANSFEPDAA